jgi:serine/threonine protein kinase
LLDDLKTIHDAGYTFNDLKLDNIVVGDAPELSNAKDSLHKIRIIDFGLAKKYIDEDGKHISAQVEQLFQGNIIFASKNAFNMVTLSRRDDLISLCYLMIYMLNGDLVFL